MSGGFCWVLAGSSDGHLHVSSPAWCLGVVGLTEQWLLELVVQENQQVDCIAVLVCWGCHYKDPHTGWFQHSSGGWKSEIKVLVRFVPLEVCEGKMCARLLPVASRWGSLPYASSHHLPCMQVCFCVQISLFGMTIVMLG